MTSSKLNRFCGADDPIVFTSVGTFYFGIFVVKISAHMLCHVFCGSAGVDEFVNSGGEDANRVPSVASGLHVHGGGGMAS